LISAATSPGEITTGGDT